MNKSVNAYSGGRATGVGLLLVSNFQRWAVVGLLFVASFINYFDRATISVALPLISLDLHLGPETKGLVLSAFFWSYSLMQIPIGWCADRWNLRWLYAGLFAIWSLACGLTGFAGSLTILILLRILLGIGESIYLPGGTKIVSLLFSSAERGFPSGVFDSGTRWGLALGAPLIAAVVTYCGWRNMFALVGFSALVWIVPWLLAAPRNLRGVRTSPVAVRSAAQRRIHFNRNLVGLCLGFFCFDYYWYLLVTWLPDYLVTVRHLTLLRAGFYASLPFFVFGVCQPLGGSIGDALVRRGFDETRTRKNMLLIAFLSGLFLIPAARVHNPHMALAFFMGGGLVGLASGNMFAIIQSCAPHDELGIWTGFENTAGNIAGVLAPIVTGFLIARTGSYFPGFALAAGVLAAGILAYELILGELNPVAPHLSSEEKGEVQTTGA
jgi:MFS family permease